MRLDLDAVAGRGPLEAGGSGEGISQANRQQLERLASEFESSLLVHMLREMRRAGRWDEGDATFGTAGSQSLFEMIDVELALHMTRARGLGLSPALLGAFDRTGATPGPPAARDPGLPAVPDHVHLERTADVAGLVGADRVSSGFGWRRDPLTGVAAFHRGIDVAAAYGQDVTAAADGRVVASGVQGGFGTTVVVEHAHGLRTRYAHLSETLVQPGDAVRAGQVVGRAGSSGRATGPHVHFELLDRAGAALDPRSALKLLEPGAD